MKNPMFSFQSKWESAHIGTPVIYDKPFQESAGIMRKIKNADTLRERLSLCLDFIWRKRIIDRAKAQGRILPIRFAAKPWFANTKASYQNFTSLEKVLFCFLVSILSLTGLFAIATGVGAVAGLPLLFTAGWFFGATFGTSLGFSAAMVGLKLGLAAAFFGTIGIISKLVDAYLKSDVRLVGNNKKVSTNSHQMIAELLPSSPKSNSPQLNTGKVPSISPGEKSRLSPPPPSDSRSSFPSKSSFPSGKVG